MTDPMRDFVDCLLKHDPQERLGSLEDGYQEVKDHCLFDLIKQPIEDGCNFFSILEGFPEHNLPFQSADYTVLKNEGKEWRGEGMENGDEEKEFVPPLPSEMEEGVIKDHVLHILTRWDKMNDPQIVRLCYKSLIDAKCKRADPNLHIFRGFTHSSHGHWQDTPFFFAHITDPQLGMVDLEEDAAHFLEAVKAVNKLRPKFLLLTGDIVNSPPNPRKEDFDEEMRRAKRIITRVNETIPVMLACGNHDIGDIFEDSDVQTYVEHFGADYYGFWYDGIRFLVLNSNLMKNPHMCPERNEHQIWWFKEELTQAKLCAHHVIIVTHHPWFLNRGDVPDSEDDEHGYWVIPDPIRSDLLHLLQSKKVKLLLSGHLHRNIDGAKAFPHGRENPNNTKKDKEEKEEEDKSIDTDSIATDDMGGGDDVEGIDYDFRGPIQVVTTSTAMSLENIDIFNKNRDPNTEVEAGDLGFRIVKVYADKVKTQFIPLHDIPPQVDL